MAEFNRRTIVSSFKAFTVGWIQSIADSLGLKDRYMARRIDALDMLPRSPMLVRAKMSTVGGAWGRPEITIKSDGVVVNRDKGTSIDPMVTEMRIEAGPVLNNMREDIWVDGVSPATVNKSSCVIPGMDGPGRSGMLWITPKDEEGAKYGDKVAADTCIVLRRDAGITEITVEADTSSYDILPDGTVWYRRWVLSLPDGEDVSPEDIRLALVDPVTSFAGFFDVYSSSLGTCNVTEEPEVTYGFTVHPMTLIIEEGTVNYLYDMLSYVFDDAFAGGSAGKTRAIVIQLPETVEDDGAGITAGNRYMTADGSVLITDSNIKYDYEIDNSVSSGRNIIVFAVRADNDTVVLCDGTRIYRKYLPTGTFKPVSGSRRFVMTGCGISSVNLEQLSYEADNTTEGTIAPWSESGTGYYKATTQKWFSDDTEVKNVWVNSDRRMAFYKHANTGEGSPVEKELMNIDRSRGYISFGGAYTNITDYEWPYRNLRGGAVSASQDIYWDDTLLQVVAAKSDRSAAGFLFSRQRDGAANDDARMSYLFQHYTLPVGDTANWGTSPGNMGGLYMLTRTRKVMVGAGPEAFRPVTDPLTEYLVDGSRWRAYTSWVGGVNPTDAALIQTVCRGGEDFDASALLPGINDYKSVQDEGTGNWGAYLITRLNRARGVDSKDANYRYDNVGLLMYNNQSNADDSVIKLMRKVGDYGTGGGVVGKDMPGDVGFKVKTCKLKTGDTVNTTIAELTAFEGIPPVSGYLPGYNQYIPKLLAGVYRRGAGFTPEARAFCGVTSAVSTELLGTGLLVTQDWAVLTGNGGLSAGLADGSLSIGMTPSGLNVWSGNFAPISLAVMDADTAPLTLKGSTSGSNYIQVSDHMSLYAEDIRLEASTGSIDMVVADETSIDTDKFWLAVTTTGRMKLGSGPSAKTGLLTTLTVNTAGGGTAEILAFVINTYP